MMNKITGYKAFNNMKDYFGNTYEPGIEYGSKDNKFHYCGHIADVFRYYNGFDDNTIVCKVEGSGEIYKYDDEVYDYLDMYESSNLKVLKPLSREEILETAFNDGVMSTLRLISSYKLTDEEINTILDRYCYEPSVKNYINYYQKNDEKAFTRNRK